LDPLPVHISHTATIIILLIGLAKLFSGMTHLQSARVLPNTIPRSPSSITAEGWHHLNQLYQRASMIAKEQVFLRNDAPCISRINLNRPLCVSSTVGGGNCNCNGGDFTFTDIDDVEAQLLKPGNGNGVKAMILVNPDTAQGVENISANFSARSKATTTLECDVAPGEARGTRNSWIGIQGAFTCTFAHWRHVSQRNQRHEGTSEEFHEGTRE
jgi:hypothetical protein